MSWRQILRTEKQEMEPIGKHPQNPQNPSSENFEDIELRVAECDSRPSARGSDRTPFPKNEKSEGMAAISAIPAIRGKEPAPQPEARKTPSHWPEGSALVVQPSWWPGPPFYIVRTEEERDALIEEREAPGMLWTLDEARKLAGLSPEEKADVAFVKKFFSSQVVAARKRPGSRSGRIKDEA